MLDEKVAMEDYKKLLERARKNLPQVELRERFEIPKPIASSTGKQTVIKNFADIANYIRRDPKHFAKFLFKELALPGSIRNNELVLQGKVSSNIIEQRIDAYVKQFVICTECKKPDTSLKKEGNITVLKCEACGARRTIKSD
jgi:translation initiation factor 2 subunit 2